MAQKEYLKMTDVFIGDVIASDDGLIRDSDGLIGDMQWPSDCVKYAAHAINSHDELVAEVERLRKIVDEGLVDDVFLDGCHAGWDASGEGHNAEFNNSDDGKIHSEFVVLLEEYKKGL